MRYENQKKNEESLHNLEWTRAKETDAVFIIIIIIIEVAFAYNIS